MAENQQIDIPGVGIVEFPSSMSDADVAMAASRLHLAHANATPLKEPTTYAGGVLKTIAPIARAGLDALPGAGAIVGGVLSTPETLGTGTIPGVALGAAAGRGLRDLIGHVTGIDAPTTPMQKAGHMAVDAAISGATQAIVPGLVEAAKAPIQTLRDASEQFGDAVPPSLRRLGRLLPSLPDAPKPTPIVSPDWLAGETSAAASSPVSSPPAPDTDAAKALEALRARGRQLAPVVQTPRTLSEPPAGAADIVDRMAGGADLPSKGNGLHPLTSPRVDVGAEVVGRQNGLTKQAVREATGPILGEAHGEASPVFPEKPLQRMIDTMKALPKEGSERAAYVQGAKDPKTMAQLENLRRTLAHLGLVVPIASAGALAKGALVNQLTNDTAQ